MNVYFVTANDSLGFCVCGGHWLASSPKEAIAEFTIYCVNNPYSTVDYSKVEWKARKSNVKAEDYALNV